MKTKLLSIAHMLVAGLMLLLSWAFGLFFLLFLFLGMLWLFYLGILLLRNPLAAKRYLRKTHYICLPLGLFFCGYGIFALQAAAKSAEWGGGLLGGIGWIPILLGAVLSGLAVLSLALGQNRDK